MSSKSIGPSEPPHPMKMLISLVEKASGFNSRDLRDVGFLFYLLTRHFQKGLTRHLKVTLHTSGPLSFLRCEPYIFRTTWKLFPVCFQPPGGSEGKHEGGQTGNDRVSVASRSAEREYEKKERKLAILTRGSIFLSCTASKGKPRNPTISCNS